MSGPAGSHDVNRVVASLRVRRLGRPAATGRQSASRESQNRESENAADASHLALFGRMPGPESHGAEASRQRESGQRE